jgi:hypothetical protein
MDMSHRRVRVIVDRLVLRNVEAAQGTALATALQKEVTRVLKDPHAGEMLARARSTPLLRLGTLPMSSGPAGVRGLGVAVGRAVAKSLKS